MGLLMRQATKEDLEDLTTIAQAAFPDDPQWDYRFPYRDQYPKDNRNWTRRQYREYLDDPEKYLIMVITAPDAERPISGKPVALAVWNVSNLQRNATAQPLKLSDDGGHVRRDAHPEHMKAFRDAMIAGMHKYFDAYGTNQLHLQILATHPDYRRQGAASSLCKWGMGIVEKKQMCISVFGSPKGKALYQHLKFMELGTLIVQVEGEEKKLTISACLYKVGKADDDWVTWVSELLKKLQLWCHGYLK